MADNIHNIDTVNEGLRTLETVNKTGWTGFTLGGNPLDIIERDHFQQTKLCQILENIADSLPDRVDPCLCRQIILALQNDMPLHHADEEDGLFPLLEKCAEPEDNIPEILACLSLEHATDESFAHELFESLEILANGQRLNNPNMIGYMLRGFFECYRRHLIWENAVVIPLARRRLQKADLEQLSKKMMKHRLKTKKV